MRNIKNQSIDLILCDLPYGTTRNKWDSILPFELLWKEYERIIKPDRAIVLFGNEPFSSYLRMSNIKKYKYDWIWKKSNVMGFLNAKRKPLKETENVIVFNSKIYYPQNLEKNEKLKNRRGKQTESLNNYKTINYSEYKNYPKTILEFKSEKGLHPTQKPVKLLEYLIKTYTTENEIVLDNCMGSGSSGLACINTNRNFIGYEKEKKYFEIAKERLEKAYEMRWKKWVEI